MNDFIAKPVMPEVFYETLLNRFEKGRGWRRLESKKPPFARQWLVRL